MELEECHRCTQPPPTSTGEPWYRRKSDGAWTCPNCSVEVTVQTVFDRVQG